MLSTDQMKSIIPDMNWTIAQTYIPFIDTILPEYEINSTLRKVHFMAQAAHESGGLKYKEENLNYSGKALWLLFRKYFASKEEAQEYHRQPERIANRIYGNRLGNGDEASGDGWRYRGRGLIQLTGRENYRKFGEAHGLDTVSNPELLIQPEHALRSACWYWRRRKINRYADEDDLHMVTRRVNGGRHGFASRQQYLEAFKELYAAM